MKCPDCKTEMKPLATSVYCPNDCDRKVTEHIDPEKTEKLFSFGTMTFPAIKNVVAGPLFGPAGPPKDPDPLDPLFSAPDLDDLIDILFYDDTD